MKCEKCGKELNAIMVSMFDFDGNDSLIETPYTECEENAVALETNENWAGYELSEKEQAECIECPHCHEFPFNDTEIQVYEIVRVVCFKKGSEENAR